MELIGTKEVSKLLGLKKYGTQILYRWREKGIGPPFYKYKNPYHKFQKIYLYDKKEVENFIKEDEISKKTIQKQRLEEFNQYQYEITEGIIK